MNKRRVSVAGVLLLPLVATACTGGGSDKKPVLPVVRPVGPILSMVPATTFDGSGRPIDPRFTFAPDHPKITVIAQVGQVHESPLTFTWYRLADGAAQRLFQDSVEVTTWDRAYSVGENPGTLASGAYRVDASLEGDTQRLEFVVSHPPVEDESDLAEQGTPPSQGSSGIVPRPPGSTTDSGYPWGQSASTGPTCRADVTNLDYSTDPTVDPTADNLAVGSFLRSGEDDECSRDMVGIVAVASGSEPPTAVLRYGIPVNGQEEEGILIDPCGNQPSLATRTDIPGAKFNLFGFIHRGTAGLPEVGQVLSAGAASGHATVKLGEDTTAPDLRVVSVPPGGTRVEPGDTIDIHVTASEKRTGGSWQTGLKFIQVVEVGGGLVAKSPVYGTVPQPCERKVWKREFRIPKPYRVPRNPPPVIRLCVIAEDIAGNEGTDCASFYTGQVWRGAMHTETKLTYPLARPNSASYDSSLVLVVDRDGVVTGHGTARLMGGSCRDIAKEIRFDIAGRAFDDHFQLRLNMTGRVPANGDPCGFGAGFFQGESLFVPIIGGDTARGTAEDVYDHAHNRFVGRHSIQLRCEDCRGR